jgi:hypothetical protein
MQADLVRYDGSWLGEHDIPAILKGKIPNRRSKGALYYAHEQG